MNSLKSFFGVASAENGTLDNIIKMTITSIKACPIMINWIHEIINNHDQINDT